MSISAILNNLVIGPLELLFEVIYALANRVLAPGWSIVALSLAVNLLVLPLYQRADAIQKEARDKEERMAPGIAHIKATFRGDEQFFMLQSFYRRNHYSPLHTLKSAIPLLLQIPFFIAAYQFLRQLGSLQGAAFGPIRDLGAQDGMLTLGGRAVNLLPILMTGINLLSGALYTRKASLKSRIQPAAIALVFLVLLYRSPAGLTMYWTLNNLFSLCKNLIRKLLPARQKGAAEKAKPAAAGGSAALFLLGALVLTLLTGLLIPSGVLSASPQEFYEYRTDLHPFWYAVNALLLSTGTFLIWFSIYYALATRRVRRGMGVAVWVASILGLINYLFFKTDLGTISSTLVYNTVPAFTLAQKLVNLGVLALAAGLAAVLAVKQEKLARGAAVILAMALGGMSARNLWLVQQGVKATDRVMERNYSGETEIPLSREGKNVVVLMLDRAISSYLPCILAEDPELAEVYSGFVYYPNTLSHGMHTNIGAPGIFGGYEYTPRGMNAREELSLREKQNEALLLMPTLFSQEDYQVSVFDMPYPGDYSEAGDYSLYDGLPHTNARVLSRVPDRTEGKIAQEALRLRNFFCYSLSMASPTALYGTLYSMGSYNRADQAALLLSAGETPAESEYPESMLEFLPHYEVLKNLGEMTRIQQAGNTLLLLRNNTSHSPTILQEPEYVPGDTSGNGAYDALHGDRFLAGPYEVHVTREDQMAHYQVNMAALRQTGEWLKALKAAGVYDNTRIIIVSDHGGLMLFQIEEAILAEEGDDICGANPLLMVKDFGAEGALRTDTAFMTNADVPALAMEGLLEDPVNPFTGNPITMDAKAQPQDVLISHAYDVKQNRGNRFRRGPWYRVSPGGDTLLDPSRWEYLGWE